MITGHTLPVEAAFSRSDADGPFGHACTSRS